MNLSVVQLVIVHKFSKGESGAARKALKYAVFKIVVLRQIFRILVSLKRGV